MRPLPALLTGGGVVSANVAALLARLDSIWSCATPGEWEVLPEEGVWASSPTDDFGTFVTTLEDLADPDAAAIVALHNAWPELAALVRRQAVALAAVEAVAAEYEAIFSSRRLPDTHRSTCLGVAQRIRAALAEQESS